MATATINKPNFSKSSEAKLDMSTFIRAEGIDPNQPVKVHRDLSNNINYIHAMKKINELSHYFLPYKEPHVAICLDIDIPADLLIMYSKSELQKGFRSYLEVIFSYKVKLLFINYTQVKANNNPLAWNGENKVKFDPLKVNELLNYFYNYMIYTYPVKD